MPPRDLIDEEYQRLYAEVHDMLIEAIKERESLESGLNDYYKNVGPSDKNASVSSISNSPKQQY